MLAGQSKSDPLCQVVECDALYAVDVDFLEFCILCLLHIKYSAISRAELI